MARTYEILAVVVCLASPGVSAQHIGAVVGTIKDHTGSVMAPGQGAPCSVWTAFELFRNNRLDAHRFFKRQISGPGCTYTPNQLRYNQFGCTLGGRSLLAGSPDYHIPGYGAPLVRESVIDPAWNDFMPRVQFAPRCSEHAATRGSPSPASGTTGPVPQYSAPSNFGRMSTRSARIVQFALKLVW
jgi:hypothetical protein